MREQKCNLRNACLIGNELTDAMASEQQIKNQESYQHRNLIQINNQKNDWENRKDEAEIRIKSFQIYLGNKISK